VPPSCPGRRSLDLAKRVQGELPAMGKLPQIGTGKRPCRRESSKVHAKNHLPIEGAWVLEKPTSCIFFISCYILHGLWHPISLLLFGGRAAGARRAQIHPMPKSPRPRAGTARRWLCCTWRSCARSLPSTRAHASARCVLLSSSRSPRGPKTA
jgi:hypothetical protein